MKMSVSMPLRHVVVDVAVLVSMPLRLQVAVGGASRGSLPGLLPEKRRGVWPVVHRRRPWSVRRCRAQPGFRHYGETA